MKTIHILLTKYSDRMSTFIYFISGGGYTHVSLSLQENADTYYSFNYHGFVTESAGAHRRRGVLRSACCHISISEEAYAYLQARLAEMTQRKASYGYTRLGVLCCLLHIPVRLPGRYFCSQFVAQLLLDAGVARLRKPPELYLPNQLLAELQGLPQCEAVQYDAL